MSSTTEESNSTTSTDLQSKAINARLLASQAIDKVAQQFHPHSIIERVVDELADRAVLKADELQESAMSSLSQKLRRNAWPAIIIGAGTLYALSRIHRRDSDPPPDK